MGYEWDGKYWWLCREDELVHRETNIRFTPRRMCEFLNFLHDNKHKHPYDYDTLTKLYLENEWRKNYQRYLEDKISRLKKRIQVLEKREEL